MSVEDLRYHMRLPSQSRATLELGSGKEIHCQVHDLSMGGAYVLRDQIDGAIPSLRRGEWVNTHLEHPDREERTTVLSEIIRVEADPGPGVALRFEIYEETAEGIIAHVNWEADRQSVAHDELGEPLLVSTETDTGNESMNPLLRRGAGALLGVGLLYVLLRLLSSFL
jgi:hypothetical protein